MKPVKRSGLQVSQSTGGKAVITCEIKSFAKDLVLPKNQCLFHP